VTYPEEILDEGIDNGTMPDNVDTLAALVIGQRIVNVEMNVPLPEDVDHWGRSEGTAITLSNGQRVFLVDTDDCCAHTYLEKFLLNVKNIDHVILGVGTTGEYTKWHVFAALGDVLQLDVSWSPGNPFYYGYGFDIIVVESSQMPVTPYEEAEALRSIQEGKT